MLLLVVKCVMKISLLVLDPFHDTFKFHSFLMDPVHCLRLLHKKADQVRDKEYEIIFFNGVLSVKEKQVK